MGRVRVLVDQPLGADDHAGCAESALHRAGDGKRVGVDVPLAGRKPLDGNDMLSFELIRLLNAGLDRFAVNEHHAGAAGTLRTTIFHAGQVERIAQVGDQLLILINDDFASVDEECRHVFSSLA